MNETIITNQNRHFSVGDISKYCMVSSVTVRRWIRDGKLSAVKLPSGHHRITTTGFRDFLEKYEIPIKEELFKIE